MNRYQKFALGMMIGVPLFFLIVSVITGNWKFFFFSLPPSLISGMTSFYAAKTTEESRKV